MWGWIISQLLLFKSLKRKGHAARRTNGNHEAQGFPAPPHPTRGRGEPLGWRRGRDREDTGGDGWGSRPPWAEPPAAQSLISHWSSARRPTVPPGEAWGGGSSESRESFGGAQLSTPAAGPRRVQARSGAPRQWGRHRAPGSPSASFLAASSWS